MGDAYPELKEKQSSLRIGDQRPRRKGLTGLWIKGSNCLRISPAGLATSGQEGAFRASMPSNFMIPTGFPLDLTQLMAEERGLTVDLEGFNREMEEPAEQSPGQSGKFVYAEAQTHWETIKEVAHSVFRGYEQLNCRSRTLCMFGEDTGILASWFLRKRLFTVNPAARWGIPGALW